MVGVANLTLPGDLLLKLKFEVIEWSNYNYTYDSRRPIFTK